MVYAKAKRIADSLSKMMRRALRLGEFGDCAVTYSYHDEPYLRKGTDGWELHGETTTCPGYLTADIHLAMQLDEVDLRRTVIHEHLHVPIAEIRRLATMMAGGDTESLAFRMYDEAEERLVVRLTRAIEQVLADGN